MPPSRLLEILGLIREAGDDSTGSTTRLCEVCADVVELTGAGIMLTSGDVPRVRCAAPTR